MPGKGRVLFLSRGTEPKASGPRERFFGVRLMAVFEKMKALFGLGSGKKAQPYKEATLRSLSHFQAEFTLNGTKNLASEEFKAAESYVLSSSEASFSRAIKRKVYRDTQQCALVMLRAAAYKALTQDSGLPSKSLSPIQQERVSLYTFAVDKLLENGYFTAQQAREEKKSLESFLGR